MASNRSPRKKFQTKYERPASVQNLFYADILHNQQMDANGEIADTLLICSGGNIRVHAFILQAASPFMQSAIASQGENYPFVREILIPDFSVRDIENMLSLIYTGYVDLRSEKEAKSLTETLKFFQVSGVEKSSGKVERIQGCLKVQELNRIPSDVFKSEIKEETTGRGPRVVVTIPDKKHLSKAEALASDNQGLRRSSRAPKPLVKPSKDDTDDPDYNPGDGDDSDDRKRARTNLKQPLLKLPRINEAAKSGPGFTSPTTPAPTPSYSTNGLPVRPTLASVRTPPSTVDISNEEKKEDSSTDTEDEDWDTPDFKDKVWFSRESRRCQTCKKSYDRAAEASLCVTSHKSLRCYFCFKVYSTTDILFKHFRRRHKQAGREATLICPFCDQAIPYKSVSCHVISVHLRTKAENEAKPGSSKTSAPNTPKSNEVRKGPGRPATTPTSNTTGGHESRRRTRSRSKSTERVPSSSNERNPAKKQKRSGAPPAPATNDNSKKKKGVQLKLPKMKAPAKPKEPTKPKGPTKPKETAKPTTTTAKTPERVLKVPELKLTLRKMSVFGKTVVFNIHKKRLGS